ncbi:hypothetical protein BU15DRAFT_37249, partial [Melanogaster broomeanus]
PEAWQIILDFAAGEIGSLPDAERQLAAHLGHEFSVPQWKPAFDEIFKAEDDSYAAVMAIEALKKKAMSNTCTTEPPQKTTTAAHASLPELEHMELELMEAVDVLHTCKCIQGTCPTLEDLLNPADEKEIGESPYCYPGGDDEIVEEVRRGMASGGILIGHDGGSSDED